MPTAIFNAEISYSNWMGGLSQYYFIERFGDFLRFLKSLIIVSMVVGMFAQTVYAESSVELGAPIVCWNGEFLVPMVPLLESLGYEVDEDAMTVTATGPVHTLEVGILEKLEHPPVKVNGVLAVSTELLDDLGIEFNTNLEKLCIELLK